MTVNLNRPPIVYGQISAADVSGARQHSSGVIWQSPHRLLPHGCGQQERHETRGHGTQQWPDTIPTDWHELSGCAPEGGKHAEPAPAAKKKGDVNGARIGFVLLLLSAVSVVGVIFGAIYARWPIAWPLG